MNENQTTYPTGAQDEEEIDLVALMVTLLHKLKPILLHQIGFPYLLLYPQ